MKGLLKHLFNLHQHFNMFKELKRLFIHYNEFVVPIGTMIGVVLLFLIVIIPLTNRIVTTWQEGTKLSEELASMKEKLSVLDSYDEDTLNTQLSEITSAIPTDKSVPSLLQTVEQVGSEVGATIKLIDVQEVGTIASQSGAVLSKIDRQFGAFTLPFSVKLNASFDVIQAFLERTATARRFIRAKAFVLKFSEAELIDIHITFDTFYLPLQKRDNTVVVKLTADEEELIESISQMQDFSKSTIVDYDTIPIDPNTSRNPFTL